MSDLSIKIKKVIGWAVVAMICGLMIFSGSMKLFGSVPPEIEASLGEMIDEIKIIGAGEIASAILFLLPLTSPFGILLVSAFWGGAIVVHMSQGETYTFQALLLIFSWLGQFMRKPKKIDLEF